MRHAVAGNAPTLKLATGASQLSHSHTFAAQPAVVGMSPQHISVVAATRCGADGPACCSRCWTPVSVTPDGGQHQADTQARHTRLVGRRCISEPQADSRGSHPSMAQSMMMSIDAGFPTEESHGFSRGRRSTELLDRFIWDLSNSADHCVLHGKFVKRWWGWVPPLLN